MRECKFPENLRRPFAQLLPIEFPAMYVRSTGTKLSSQDLIKFLFDSAVVLRRQLEDLLMDAVLHSPLRRPHNRAEAAEGEGTEQQPRTESRTASMQAAKGELRKAHDGAARCDCGLCEINLTIENLRSSLAQTRLELAEVRNRAEEADRVAQGATEALAHLRARGLLGRLLNRD
jgi:hypothetical protein